MTPFSSIHRLIASIVIAVMATNGFAATALQVIPASAPRGARIVVRGTGLGAGELQVRFADGAQGTDAAIQARTSQSTEVTVPPNAVSGEVRVTHSGSQIAALPFTVRPDARFESVRTIATNDLKSPGGVAVDPATGNVYVADTKNHRINVITAQGMALFAGSGQPGQTDAVGAQARFKEPSAIAFDAVRKLLYVADTMNHAVRRVTLDGVVTTLAGSGKPDDHDGAGAGAEFKQPAAIAIDAAGNVVVADTANNRIKKITRDGVVTTIAGTGRDGFADGAALDARFAEPEGLAVDARGNVYVADTRNHRIRRIASGIVTTIAGSGDRGLIDGLAGQARFDTPRGIALDDAENLFIADSGNDVVRKLNATAVTTVAGRASINNGRNDLVDGPALQAQFDDPHTIAIAGALFVADAAHDAIRIVLPELALSDLYPRRGPLAGGNEVRLFGVGFIPERTTATVAGIAANVTFVTSTEIVITMPPRPSGPATIVVTTPAGSATLTDRYTYLAPPTLTSITPAKGTTAGGETATIRGTELAAGETEVLFGTVARPR
jgi:DNA-binding beta-propeller fold protein YncE